MNEIEMIAAIVRKMFRGYLDEFMQKEMTEELRNEFKQRKSSSKNFADHLRHFLLESHFHGFNGLTEAFEVFKSMGDLL